MIDREKVAKGLKCLKQGPQNGVCGDCVYFRPFTDDPDCGLCDTTVILDDAIALLHEHMAYATWLFGEIITAYDECGVKTWAVKHKCSKCGFVNIAIEAHTGQYSYCPSCGARMRREGEVEWD